MKNKAILILIFIFLFSGFSPLQSQQSITLKKDIVVAENEVQDNVFTFGGNILIEGKVTESVVAFGGKIVVNGEVEEIVLGIGSHITLNSTAVVNGDLVSIGGTLEKESGSTIKGDTIYFKTSEDIDEFLNKSLLSLISFSWIPFLLVLKLIGIFIWLIITMVLTGLFPRQVSFSSSQIKNNFWPIMGTGLLSIIIFSGLVIFSALLSLIIIGIPILISLIILGIVIKAFGKVVLFHFAGEYTFNTLGWKKGSPLVYAIIGLFIVSLLEFIPVLGALISLFVSIAGWGAAIRTKFGTTENWFKK